MGAPLLVLIPPSRTADLALDGLRSIKGRRGPLLAWRLAVSDIPVRVGSPGRQVTALVDLSPKGVDPGPGRTR